MGAENADTRITMLTAINNWRLHGTQKDVIEQVWPEIEGCECALEAIAAAALL